MSEESMDTLLWLLVVLASALPTLMAVRRIRHLRREVAEALTETSRQQAAALDKMGQALLETQKQQQVLVQQLQIVASAYQRLRDDVAVEIAQRQKHAEPQDDEGQPPQTGARTVH